MFAIAGTASVSVVSTQVSSFNSARKSKVGDIVLPVTCSRTLVVTVSSIKSASLSSPPTCINEPNKVVALAKSALPAPAKGSTFSRSTPDRDKALWI